MKKGLTLIELTVAMGIFSIISTLVVGGYVVVLNMKTLTANLRESQQKLRQAIEITSRLARQAESIAVTNSGRTATMYFGGSSQSAIKFSIDSTGSSRFTLNQYTCDAANVDKRAQDCTTWNSPTDMLGGTVKLYDKSATEKSIFEKVPGVLTALNINLFGKIEGVPSKSFTNDDLTIKNSVIMESEK